MSRLIDADKLIEDITITINEWIKDMVDGEYLKGCVNFSVVARDMIKKQSTAYDVDKVVEQLGKLRDKANLNVLKNMNEPIPYSSASNRAYAYDMAIEVVKAGGIDEETS